MGYAKKILAMQDKPVVMPQATPQAANLSKRPVPVHDVTDLLRRIHLDNVTITRATENMISLIAPKASIRVLIMDGEIRYQENAKPFTLLKGLTELVQHLHNAGAKCGIHKIPRSPVPDEGGEIGDGDPNVMRHTHIKGVNAHNVQARKQVGDIALMSCEVIDVPCCYVDARAYRGASRTVIAAVKFEEYEFETIVRELREEIATDKAEAMAINLARQRWPGVKVYSDCKSVVSAINESDVIWIPRAANRLADRLVTWKGVKR